MKDDETPPQDWRYTPWPKDKLTREAMKDDAAQIIKAIDYGHIESISLAQARTLTDALAAKDAEIAGLKGVINEFAFWICESHPECDWPHDNCGGPGMPAYNRVRLYPVDIAALTADLAARGETIVRLEGELATVEAVLADTREVYAMSVEIENRLTAQLIEERWQKNRAEFERDHHSSNVMSWACVLCYGKSVDPRHAYTPDDWRRDAREQLINEGVIKT